MQFDHEKRRKRNIMHHEPAFAQDEYAMYEKIGTWPTENDELKPQHKY